MEFVQFKIYFSLLVIFLITFCQFVIATRTRVGPPNEDPPTTQVYNDLRHILAHPNYYYLQQAGIPVAQEELSPVLFQGNTIYDQENFARNHFKFNSSEHIRRHLTFRWFISLDERIAMHVYDNPQDQELATGPQVNQDLCSIHLDYLLHIIRKHHRHVTDSNDMAIFKLMNTYDIPHQGLAEGNSIFPGSYDACKSIDISFMKNELNDLFKGNKNLIDRYFTLTSSVANVEHKVMTVRNLFARVNKFAQQTFQHIQPFLGYYAEDSIKTRPISVKAKNKLKTIGTRYCLTGLRWPEWSNSSWYRRHMTMRVATCLPETCDSSSLRLQRDKIHQLIAFNMPAYYSQYYIENMFCLPDENSTLRNPFNYLGSKLFIIFLSIWFLLTIFACLMHHKSKKSSKKQRSLMWCALRYWCVQKNFNDFFVEKKRNNDGQSTNESSTTRTTTSNEHSISGRTTEGVNQNADHRFDLRPLEGLKVLGSISVMTSHAIMLIYTSTKSPLMSELNWQSWHSIVGTLCPLVVDVFFVITGAMTMRHVAPLARQHKLTVTFWLKYIIYRYLRMIPLYLIMHLFLQHAFRFIGSGPFWDYGVSYSSWSKGCQDESVWRVILPTANFVSPSVHCNGVGWYVANDMQLTLIIPFVIYVLTTKPLLGHSLVLVSCLLGSLAHVKYFLDHDPDPRGLLEWTGLTLNRITDDNIAGYINPQYRFVALFVGLSLGHLLDMHETGQIKTWPKWLITGGKWFFYLHLYLSCALPFLSSYTLDWNPRTVQILAASIPGLSHLSAAIAISGFIIALTSNNISEPITQFMASRPMKLIASMAHSTMLVHLPLMFYHQQTARTLPAMVTKYDIFKTTIIWELEAFLMSFVVHILFEVPLRKLLVGLLLSFGSSRKGSMTSERDDDDSGGRSKRRNGIKKNK